MSPTIAHTSRWKGKARAVSPAVEGPGATEGVVLPLDMVGGGIYDVAYVVPVRVGRKANPSTFTLQVDTGSSDLWIASSSCSTSSCSQTGGHLYNPSQTDATDTGVPFAIDYLLGHVDGPVYWDRVEVGGYSIENQALAAASKVTDEPLAPNFNGILGLALPLNSIIAKDIPAVTTNDPDGAAWASNLFSITPVSNAPASRFLSLSLSRPGSDRIPSLLGIGRHPSALVSDPAQIHYSTLVAERSGTLFWKTSVRAITVYVDGVPKPVEIGRSVGGSVFPTAVLDSGVPLIVTTSTIANAIYGALGVHPAADGQYYVPCSTPLNMSITLDNRPPIPIHPLDVTAEPPGDNKADFCVGMIQVADSELGKPNSIGDMILGVPFMRNTYTVMAYARPNQDGTFSQATSTGSDNSSVILQSTVNPMLGLLSLTDPEIALQEFNTVRILNQPIKPSNTNGTHNNPLNAESDGKKMSVGIIVLIGLLSFFALCCTLFGLRWYIFRRKFRAQQATFRAGVKGESDGFGGGDMKRELVGSMLGLGGGAYQLAHRISKADEQGSVLSEDSLRKQKYQEYLIKHDSGVLDGKEDVAARDSTSSASAEDDNGHGGEDGDRTLGTGTLGFAGRQQAKPTKEGEDDPWDPTTGLPWSGALALPTSPTPTMGSRKSYPHRSRNDSVALPTQPLLNRGQDSDRDSSPERPFHQRTSSELDLQRQPHHRQQSSTAVPLLHGHHSPTQHSYDSADNTASPDRSYPPHLNHHHAPSYPPPSTALEDSDFAPLSSSTVHEFGGLDGGGMAGVGTASRTNKIKPDGVHVGRISTESIRRDRGENPAGSMSSRSRSRKRSEGSTSSRGATTVVPPLPIHEGQAL